MLDAIYIAATAAFFVASILYVLACDRLGQEGKHEGK